MELKRDELNQILDRTLEMQKYIEAKNAILLTINLAIVTILHEVFKLDFSKTWHWIIFGAIFLSILISIISFMPIMKIKKIENNKNIYFFGDVSKMTENEFDTLVESKNEDDLNKDLAKQIIINSQIVNRKIRFFKLAIRVLTILGLLLYIYECYKQNED